MGLPWVLDVVSAWATFHYGFTQSFYFRVSLDVVNLFTVHHFNIIKNIHRYLQYLIVKGGVDIPGPGWLDTNYEENPREQAAAKTELHQEQLPVQKQQD